MMVKQCVRPFMPSKAQYDTIHGTRETNRTRRRKVTHVSFERGKKDLHIIMENIVNHDTPIQ